jgi:hypothetical protein
MVSWLKYTGTGFMKWTSRDVAIGLFPEIRRVQDDLQEILDLVPMHGAFPDSLELSKGTF